MGLKEMLKQQPFETELPEQSEMQSRTKDLEMIQELTDRITELTLINSELQSKNQEMRSALTTANEQIETLTARASNLSEIETMNQKLSEVTIEATATRDRAAQQAGWAAEWARREEARAKEAEQRQYAAEQAARKADSIKNGTQTLYRSLFIGWGVFTLVLAFLNAWEKRSVFQEIGQWWADRWGNLMTVALALKTAFLWLASLMGRWGVPEPWGYVFAAAVAAGVGVGLFFAGKRLGAALAWKYRRIKGQYRDGVFKATMSAATALGLFFICLWFYEPIRSVWPFNIFSLWLSLAILGGVAWNFPEINASRRL